MKISYMYFLVFVFFKINIFHICKCLSGPDIPEICPNIISHKRWGARTAIQIEYVIIPVEYVIIHHTADAPCSTENQCAKVLTAIQDYHMDVLEYDDIGYNFLVGGDGNIYEGCGWHKVGAHTRKYNSKSLGVAFMGTFTNELPNPKQLQAAKDFLKCAEEIGELSSNYTLYAGRQVVPTLSPGTRLYRELQDWPHFGKTPSIVQ